MPSVVVNAPVNMLIDDGNDNDSIAVICGFHPQPDPPVFPLLVVNSTLQVTVLGDNGDDSLTGFLTATVGRGGAIDAEFLGGRGMDAIGVEVDTRMLTPESGRLAVHVDGGLGDDQLQLLASGATQPLPNAEFPVNGGRGANSAVVTPNVQVLNARIILGGLQ